MQIPFDQFEKYIDKIILERGLSYFENGYINEPEEITRGVYTFMVKGTQDYTVQLAIQNGIITGYACDCPYDMGPVCKHVAAALFYLQQKETEVDQKKVGSKSGKAGKSKSSKTVADQVKELLNVVTHKELKHFIYENALDNKDFRNLFLLTFAKHNTDESKTFYVRQLKFILHGASNRHDFINWSASMRVGRQVDDILKAAQNQIEQHNYKSAFFMCTAVMEQLTEALQYSDDSYGSIGGCINTACEMLYTVAEEQSAAHLRKLILDYCFSAIDHKIFAGWDWHIDMLRIASMLIKTDEEADRSFKQIDRIKISDYTRETAQSIKYDILLKIKGAKAAEKYLQQHITNPYLRRKAVDKALKTKKYKQAIQLAEDGIAHDQKNKAGLALEWYDWLLKIALAQGDKEKIIEYARCLLIDNYRDEQDYYLILKQNVKEENWNSFLEEVIKEITDKKSWWNTNFIAEIYIKEKWWDRLLELVKKTGTLDTIETYEKYLKKNYADDIIDLYAAAIVEYLHNNVGRNHYRTACRYLRRMIKLGGKKKVDSIISYLGSKYLNRRALLDELNNI